MDALTAIKTSVYDRLTSSPVLQDLFEEEPVRIDNVWAQPNQEFPYIVYRLQELPDGAAGTITLTLDLWDFAETSQRLYSIWYEVQRLLEWMRWDLEEGYFRIRLTQATELAEGERSIWRINSNWSIRYTRDAIIT